VGAEVGEDHEVVADEAVLAVDYPPHRVAPMGMMLPFPVVRTAEDRVLVVMAPVIRTFETMRVKATTVKGVFTIAGAADVEVAEDSLVADEVTEVA
jgi:hypothetical protein